MYIKITEEQRIVLLKAIDMFEGSENTSISCDRECRRLEDILSLSNVNNYDVVDLAKTAMHGLITSNQTYNGSHENRDLLAKDAIAHAEALIEELNK